MFPSIQNAGKITLYEGSDPAYDEKFKKNYFQEGPRVFQRSSPELRSMSGRNESFWDGLGPEIDGAHPDFLGVPKSSPRAEGTFRRSPIDPFRGAMAPH